LLALLGGATGIGFAPVLVKLSEIGPTATAFFRILIALPFLWCFACLEAPKPSTFRRPNSRRDFFRLALAGIFFAADLTLWHWSLQFTTVATSTLLVNSAPLFVTLGAWLIFRERITRRFLLGLLVAMGGVAMLVGNSYSLSGKHLWGDLLSVLTAVSYAGYMLVLKDLRRSFSTLTIMAWSGVVSCVVFGVVAWLSGDRLLAMTARGWGVLVGLALISHVGGQTLIAYGFGHLPASYSSLSLLWQPVVAAVIAWGVLGEGLRVLQVAGAMVVLVGILIGTASLGGAEWPGKRKAVSV
jgi:drug/metabolite transporter (DMT)-like permease